MTSELRTIELQQNMITQLNQEIDGLHDALGILHAEIERLKVEVERFKHIGGILNVDNVFLRSKIEQLQAIIAKLETENIRLKQFAWPWLEMGESFHWPKVGPSIKCDYASMV